MTAIAAPEHPVSCRWCNARLGGYSFRRGRPPAYCSIRCRRAVEYRLRALYRDHARTAMDVRLFGGIDTRMHLRGIEVEITRLGGNVANIFGVRNNST